MFTGRGKIVKPKDKDGKETPVTEFEERIAQEIFNLQNASSNEDIKPTLENLYIVGADQIQVGAGKESIVLQVPFTLLKSFQQVQDRLVRELEKKFSGNTVVIVAKRTILPPGFGRGRKGSAIRPRSRSLTAVHEAILEDIVHPTEIVGKRTLVKKDGSKIMKIILDPKEKTNVSMKTETFQVVYKKLTGKDVSFDFEGSN